MTVRTFYRMLEDFDKWKVCYFYAGREVYGSCRIHVNESLVTMEIINADDIAATRVIDILHALDEVDGDAILHFQEGEKVFAGVDKMERLPESADLLIRISDEINSD